MTKGIGVGTVLLLAWANGMGAAEREPKAARESELTLGLVQKEVRIGMSQADLVSALGSPNILTRDSKGREAWVYDRFATEARVTSTGYGGSTGAMAGVGTTLLLGLLSGEMRDEKVVSSQRTLTVVIRFDLDGRVESFAFHSTRF